ncbi:MAG TPA: GNAT family N-acetyltransferase [Saprospiraceae bacterium]|nr:GNAT family N-acetyltransferase [Saprospiraceae bacterium]HQW56129.1 GNAT family N-acetyltransferase [Saprospiraceae bacterium]
MEFIIINSLSGQDSKIPNDQVAHFLYEHLEQYGDTLEDIQKCISYVMNPDKGGNIIIGLDAGKMVGATILNNTGMGGYIPENILVYIAVDQSQRGKGYGKQLMQHAINNTHGGIALHVEPDNPAKILYEKLGFTNKYLEMRLIN